jgi:fused signal recognition particle receptor
VEEVIAEPVAAEAVAEQTPEAVIAEPEAVIEETAVDQPKQANR